MNKERREIPIFLLEGTSGGGKARYLSELCRILHDEGRFSPIYRTFAGVIEYQFGDDYSDNMNAEMWFRIILKQMLYQ